MNIINLTYLNIITKHRAFKGLYDLNMKRPINFRSIVQRNMIYILYLG